MKNFSTRKKLSARIVPMLAALSALFSSSCDRVEQPVQSPAAPVAVAGQISDISAEEVARMLSGLSLSIVQVREVYDGVNSSVANGYDEEYPFSNVFSSPGAGVGDEMLATRSAVEYPEPLRDLLSTVCAAETRSGALADVLADSGLQIYWPYSEDWDGETMPVITFDPEDSRTYSISVEDSGKNVGFLREQLPGGSWIVKEVIVDEEYARTRPVWVINHNEDSSFMTPQMLEALYPERYTSLATRSVSDSKTLVLKEFKAHRNYDSWFAGGSEFFVKCGSLNGFTAKTEDELKLYSPSVTDMMINVKRKQVGKTLRFNTVLVSEWTPQLEECVFLMIEDDGGKQTSWKASGLVKIKSRSYGFEVEIPLRRNDDLVWRGKLSGNYFEKYNGKPNRFGDVSVTFSFM